jgi:hypothetical protein
MVHTSVSCEEQNTLDSAPKACRMTFLVDPFKDCGALQYKLIEYAMIGVWCLNFLICMLHIDGFFGLGFAGLLGFRNLPILVQVLHLYSKRFGGMVRES